MQLSNTPEELQKAYRAIAAIIVLVVVVAATTVAVHASYGVFSDDMLVHADFARAGQGLHAGSDVKYRGVNVGKVRSIHLRGDRVEVVLQIHRSEHIPASTSATVRAKTLFGEKYVALSVTQHDDPPYLKSGQDVRSGGTGTEVDELVDSTDHLLRKVDAPDLTTLMSELTKAYQGEGERVARLIDKTVGAANAFDATLQAQLQAVDSFDRFSHEYRDVRQINAISGNLDVLLPTFNAARDDFERLLTTLGPFADHLADFVEVNHTNIDTILTDGDNIVRVLTARRSDISESIAGLARYTYVLSHAISKEQLPDGSRFGYLKLFVNVGDLQQLVCAALGSTGPGASLGQVREALAAVAPQLACPGDAPAKSAAGSGAKAAPDPSTALTNTVMGQVARPDDSTGSGSVDSLLGPLLGAAA